MKNQEITYYKVVRVVYGLMISLVVDHAAQIIYSTKAWSTTPSFLEETGRGPMVFDQLENAITFAMREFCQEKVEIWECEVMNPHAPIGFCDIEYLEMSMIRSIPYYTFPRHTVECDSVKLIKRVFEKDPN